MRRLIIILIAILIFTCEGAYAYSSNEINIYAAPYGDDILGNGTIRKPYKSVEKVSETVKLYMKSGTEKNINAVFRGGEYKLRERIEIDSLSKSGYSGTVTYKSYENERAIFVGANHDFEWTSLGNGLYSTTVDSEVNVVFEDGEPSSKARYPNKSEHRMDGYLSAEAGGTREYLMFKEGDFPKITSKSDLQVCVFDGGELCLYSMNILGATLDYDEHKILFSKNTAMKCVGGSKYFIQNSRELLDAPGEMYYDSDEKTLYYMPRNPENLSKVHIPYLTQAFRMIGTKENPIENIRISGIDFKYFGAEFSGTPATVYAYYGNNIEISDCSFEGIGGMGVELYYTNHSRLTGNKLENVGATGIFIRDTDAAGNEGNNVISNNCIKNVGFYYATSNGIDIVRSSKNQVLNNTVSGCTRAAINLAGSSEQTFAQLGTEKDGVILTRDNMKPYLVSNDNVVSGNDLSDSMLETNDGGVIYTWAIGYDNIISDNYIHDSGADFSWNFGAVYLDDDTNRTQVTRNYITRLGDENGNLRDIFFIKGQDNQIENNFIVNCKPGKGVARVDSQSGTGPVGNVVFRKNVFYNSGSSLFDFYGIAKQPENPLNVKFKECDYNLYYDSSNYYEIRIRDENQDGATKKLCDISEWRSDYGWDIHSVFQKAEFADSYTEDFRLTGNGAAADFGIDGIDISKCGVGEEYRFTSDASLEKLYLSVEDSVYANVEMNCGEQRKLCAVAKTKDGIIIKDVRLLFGSSDSETVSVTDGVITAKKAGKARITAVCMAGKQMCTAEVYVYVK